VRVFHEVYQSNAFLQAYDEVQVCLSSSAQEPKSYTLENFQHCPLLPLIKERIRNSGDGASFHLRLSTSALASICKSLTVGQIEPNFTIILSPKSSKSVEKWVSYAFAKFHVSTLRCCGWA
jgi:hypothetical protein